MRRSLGHRIWLLPLLAFCWNQVVYCGANVLVGDLPHMDWTTPVDRLVPFLPWTVLIYLGCFPWWALVYLHMARQKTAYRFFCADFLAKGVCFLCFILLPTTNLRPEVVGTALWDYLLRLVYAVDAPTNLFPSIHCMVSWLCWIGLRGEASPALVRNGSLLLAIAVCISTLCTRQHVLLDVAAGILLAECAWRVAELPTVTWWSTLLCKRLQTWVQWVRSKSRENPVDK